MDTTYNKENLQVHLELIKPIGYTLESFGNEFFYTKQETQRKITISVSYDEYFPHDISFTGAGVNFLYFDVEQILHDVYINNPISDFRHTINESNTFHKNFNNILSESYNIKLKSTEVDDDASFYIVKPLIEQMINAAINFINQYQSLQDLYNFGEAMNDDDQLNFYEHPASFRMAIIKKLLNLSYDTFLQNEITIYNQHGMANVASFATALKNHLDSI